MNHFWASSLMLFAVVQYSAVAFKIPGLSSSSSSINRTPPVRGPANNGGGHRGPESEYMGPVFIIRELDKDKGEYDAFVTTGGIQEVRPPPMSDRSLPPQNGKPSAARDDEDAEHFGVLVTPETVKRLDRDEKLRASFINVTMTVLLTAASSRMPWLLVLHRKQYPHLFEYQQQQPLQHQYQAHSPQQQQHQPHQQQQPQQYQQQMPQFLQPVQSDAAPIDSGVPGLQHPQIPQRRRYQTDRQRRTISYSSPDDSRTPMTIQHQLQNELLSTMCYNFFWDIYSSPIRQTSSAEQSPRLPITLANNENVPGEDRRDREREGEPEQYDRYRKDFYLDADAYAAAATAPLGRGQHMPQPLPLTSTTVQPEEQSNGVVAGMEIPKRVS